VTSVVTARKQVADIIRLANRIDATAFITVEETRHVLRGHQRLIK
jgi:uncharacterized membrane-anchored protein YitT (DUF2179 family)